MAERQPTDADLRRAALSGDGHAWKSLYDSAFEGLYAYVQWRTGGARSLTEDIVQETWLVAVRRIAGFEPRKGSFRSWVRGTAANVLRNHYRANRRHPAPLDSVPELSIEKGHPESLTKRIAQALADLPDHYEAVLRLKYLERRSMEEIAAENRTTVKAVESLLSRARAAFERAYGTRDQSERNAIQQRIQR